MTIAVYKNGELCTDNVLELDGVNWQVKKTLGWNGWTIAMAGDVAALSLIVAEFKQMDNMPAAKLPILTTDMSEVQLLCMSQYGDVYVYVGAGLPLKCDEKTTVTIGAPSRRAVVAYADSIFPHYTAQQLVESAMSI